MNFQWLFDRPIAHRGLHNEEYPENSIPAYKNAIEHGYNIEIDVHLSKDGHLVVFHDDTLTRICGVDKKIKDCTLEELKTMRLKGTEYTIPTFEEFLECVDGKTGVLCEIKGLNIFDNSIVKATIEALKNYKGNIALQSFNFGAVMYAKKHCDLPVGELFTWMNKNLTKCRWSSLNFMGKLHIAYIAKPMFIAYDVRACGPEYSENKWLKKWSKKLPVIMWTIKSEENMQTARKYANNIIFEDLPVEFVEQSVGTYMPLHEISKENHA